MKNRSLRFLNSCLFSTSLHRAGKKVAATFFPLFWVVPTALGQCPGDLAALWGRVPKLTDARAWLSQRDAQALDLVKTRSPRFDTTFYHPVHEPGPDGRVPLIPPDAKAVVLFFHGSGTHKASGKNFGGLMNSLKEAGVAGIGFDMPFHGEGPANTQFHNANHFMSWLHDIVQDIKREAPGKKIYFAGHSFGPEVAQEYLARYQDVEGALLVSPAGDFHPAMSWTYQNVTTPGERFMAGAEDIKPNDAGGAWAGAVSQGFVWTQRKNPNPKISVVIGERDEWWPGNPLEKKLGVKNPYTFEEPLSWLRSHYPNAKFHIQPGVGHYIFESKAENGRPLILEKIFELVEVPPQDRYPAAPAERTNRQHLAALYAHSPLFRQWIGNRYPYATQHEQAAAEYLMGWKVAERSGWKAILEKMPEEHPDFYKTREASWALLRRELEKDISLNHSKVLREYTNEMKQFQMEFKAYLEAKQTSAKWDPAPDPLMPKAEVSRVILGTEPIATKEGISLPVYLGGLDQALAKLSGALVQKKELLGNDKIAKITYSVDGKEKYLFVVNERSSEKAQALIERAFLDACRKNGFYYPQGRWEGEADGIRFKGKNEGSKITGVVLVPPA